MPILKGAGEPTPIDDAWQLTTASEAEPTEPPTQARPARKPSPRAARQVGAEEPPAPTTQKIGIVFVHGIGSQAAGETLFDWAAPLIRTVWAWAEQQAAVDGKTFRDPVDWAQVDLTGQGTSVIEVTIPAVEKRNGRPAHPPQSWIITEAWWAADVKAAGIAEMVAWGKRHVGTIVAGILTGIRLSVANRGKDPTMPDNRESAPGRRFADDLDVIAIQVLFKGAAIIAAPLYALVRVLQALPIPKVSEAITTEPLDWFLSQWFGDVRILLHDRAQAANLRRILGTTILKLQNYGADRIVLVAHSGGTVLSYMLLADPEHASADVDKFITHGEAIGLAWRVGGRDDPMSPDFDAGLRDGDRLLLGVHRPGRSPGRELPRWVDFHATHDVAPAFSATGWPRPGGLPTPGRRPHRADGPDESWTIVNRMSVKNDHGGYWENEEQFVIPLLRELDTPDGTWRDSRFYPVGDAASRGRVLRRESRVRGLALWWNVWMVMLATALIAGLAASLAPNLGLAALGRGSIDVIRPLPLVGIIADLPPWLLGGVIVVALFIVIAQLGVGAWNALDEKERIASRNFTPPTIPRTMTRGQLRIYLLAGIAAIVCALTPQVSWTLVALAPAWGPFHSVWIGLTPLVVFVAIVLAAWWTPLASAIGRSSSDWLPEVDVDPGPAPALSPPEAPTPRPARGTPRTRPAARRTSRRASRTRSRTG